MQGVEDGRPWPRRQDPTRMRHDSEVVRDGDTNPHCAQIERARPALLPRLLRHGGFSNAPRSSDAIYDAIRAS